MLVLHVGGSKRQTFNSFKVSSKILGESIDPLDPPLTTPLITKLKDTSHIWIFKWPFRRVCSTSHLIFSSNQFIELWFKQEINKCEWHPTIDVCNMTLYVDTSCKTIISCVLYLNFMRSSRSLIVKFSLELSLTSK